MFLGIDVSTYFDELNEGAKYYYQGKEIDPLQVFRDHGVTYMRIRVWNDPYGPNGEPYLAGTNDTECFLKLAKLAMSYGYRIILDFHYSDFWADPGRQLPPKAWQNLTYDQVVEKMYEFTLDVVKKAKQENIPIDYVQVGNEITNGMLWPFGGLDHSVTPRGCFDKLAALLKSGIKAVKECYPEAKICIHLEKSCDWPTFDEYFTHMELYGVEYDVIAASYYPHWHGSLEYFFKNMKQCQEKFHKETMVMEFGYGFTLEKYHTDDGDTSLILSEEIVEKLKDNFPEPNTPEGQAKYIRDLLRLSKENNMLGVCYWEPLWIPGKDIYWASQAALDYIHEEAVCTKNEWANQCLFDYNGNALPAFDEYNINKGQ